jgi:hypothetical protein
LRVHAIHEDVRFTRTVTNAVQAELEDLALVAWAGCGRWAHSFGGVALFARERPVCLVCVVGVIAALSAGSAGAASHGTASTSDFGANAFVRFDPETEKFTQIRLASSLANVRQIHGRRDEVWGAESGIEQARRRSDPLTVRAPRDARESQCTSSRASTGA